jgi:integrase
VHLPRFLRDELAWHLASRPSGPDDLVFTAARGGPIRESKWVPGYFKPALRAAGLPPETRYDLRHTAASLLIREGASIKAVQRYMGHATAAITLDVYGHLFPDELPDLAERLDALRARTAPQQPPGHAPDGQRCR